MFFQKINQIRPLEHEFTEVLEGIALTPKMLYCAGKLPKNVVLDGQESNFSPKSQEPETDAQSDTKRTGLATRRRPVVAIVGARSMTPYGREIAFGAAHAAAKAGAVVVSGLAYGIDATAHRGALAAGGLTVAVLGTPLSRVYPRANEPLAREIVAKNGAVITEVGEDDYYHPKGTFLQRNRIISGLADVVMIVEAAARSGSLNTAAHALEQGKEVLAVPGSLNAPKSAGCNSLLRQGATPYLGESSLLDLLFPERVVLAARERAKKVLPIGDTPLENEVIRLLGRGLRDGVEMIRESNWLDAATFNRTITLLEIKGIVASLGANQWVLRSR